MQVKSSRAPVSGLGSDWQSRGTCAQGGVDPELFFPVGTTGPALVQVEQARAVCRRCPVAGQCLSWALETGEKHGVWGGLDADERDAVRRAQEKKARAEADRIEAERAMGIFDGIGWPAAGAGKGASPGSGAARTVDARTVAGARVEVAA